MQFEITHEFDIPLDAIELAVLSPRLIDQLGPRLPDMETVTQTTHVLEDGVLQRVWHFGANIKLPEFAKPYLAKEVLSWEERSTYALKTHDATWEIGVKPEWRKYFRAAGSYSLVPRGDGSARIIRGKLEVIARVGRPVAERLVLNQVKKIYEAEAETLRDLATLV